MKLLRRLCPHPFGWSLNTFGTRRFCRLCAKQQRRDMLGPPTLSMREAHRLLEHCDKLGAQAVILGMPIAYGPWQDVMTIYGVDVVADPSVPKGEIHSRHYFDA